MEHEVPWVGEWWWKDPADPEQRFDRLWLLESVMVTRNQETDRLEVVEHWKSTRFTRNTPIANDGSSGSQLDDSAGDSGEDKGPTPDDSAGRQKGAGEYKPKDPTPDDSAGDSGEDKDPTPDDKLGPDTSGSSGEETQVEKRSMLKLVAKAQAMNKRQKFCQ